MVFLLALVFFSLSTSVTALPMNQWPHHNQPSTHSSALVSPALPRWPGPENWQPAEHMVSPAHPGAPVSPAALPMGSGPGPEHRCTMWLGSEYRQQAEHDPMWPGSEHVEHDPMNPHHPHAETLLATPVGCVALDAITEATELASYAVGCWTPDSPVSERCCFNVTSFELLIGKHPEFCPAFCVLLSG